MRTVRTLSILLSGLTLAALLQAAQPGDTSETDSPVLQEDIKKLTTLGIPIHGHGLLE